MNDITLLDINPDEYVAYQKYFDVQHPSSRPVMGDYTPRSSYPEFMQTIVLLMFICAALLSGVHTIPTVYEGIEVTPIITEDIRKWASVSSFVAIEISLLVSAYMLASNRKIAISILGVGFAVAMISNIYSVFKAMQAKDVGVIIVALVIGIGMPLIALLAGKMLISMNQAKDEADDKMRIKFKEAVQQYEEKVQAAYVEYKRRTQQRIRVSRPDNTAPRRIPSETGLPAETRGTPINKRSLVEQLFAERPETINLSSRSVMAILEGKVGHSFISTIQAEYRNRQNADNEDAQS